MRWSRRSAAIVALALLALACAPSSTALDPSLSAEIHDDAIRTFLRARLWSPEDGNPMAPLFVVEQQVMGEIDDDVTLELQMATQPFEDAGRSFTVREYRWSFSDGRSGGLRGVFGEGGFALLYEVLDDSRAIRRFFVSTEFEATAAAEFGEMQQARRFAIERSMDETPRTVVAAEFESGSTPLGPFIYLDAARGDVTTVICRCMPAQVESIDRADSYTLQPGELSEFRLSEYAEALRWPR